MKQLFSLLFLFVFVSGLSLAQDISYNQNPQTEQFGQLPLQNDDPITITESVSQTIIAGNSVACNNGSFHTNNSYFRAFTLTDFGITEDFNISMVEIGVEQAIGNGGTQPITVYLYTSSQTFPNGYPGSLTQIGTANINVPDQSLTIFQIPVTGTAPAGSELVVEIFTPDGQTTGNSFFIGSNNLGQTGPSYLMAADCGVTTPTDVAAIGFPGMHIVMNVTGETGGPVTTFTDNFDSYLAGEQLACQSSNWTTWSNLPCDPTEDAYISTNYSYSGANSVVIVQNNDQVRLAGSLTSGKWYMSFLLYIPTGKAGYFNQLSGFTPNPFQWAVECYFDAGGAGRLVADVTTNFTWQENTWQQVVLIVDLDTHNAEFWFGDTNPLTMIYSWDWTRGGTINNQIDANDFFGATANDEMYMDNYYFGDAMPPIIPVELTSFTATANQNKVELNWTTATETNNQGFDIERNSGNGFEKVGYIPGFGTTTEEHSYSFTDAGMSSGNYSYRLKQVDFAGTFTYSNEVEVEVIAPAEYSLDQNYPNPFNPSTKITFSLATDSKVSLKVFDVIGQEIASLINQELTAGVHNVDFNAAGYNSGVYFYRIEASGVNGAKFVDVKKMILMK